jgi:hypothetical protein
MVAEALFKRSESQKYRPLRIQWAAAELYAALLKRTRCVSLMETDRPLLADINEHNFQELQRLMSTATDILLLGLARARRRVAHADRPAHGKAAVVVGGR